VHDENAWALGGVSGHAGVFSTAYDLAVFCQMILNNGTYGGVKVLEPWTVDLIFHNYNTACVPRSPRLWCCGWPTAVPNDAHGLGFELNQTYWSGPMRSLQTAGHTGFTGTTLFIDRPTNTFAIQLAHRVHPSRKWASTNISREWIGTHLRVWSVVSVDPTGTDADRLFRGQSAGAKAEERNSLNAGTGRAG
jgi:CubicO group peptidase (beta-lactamase class C family)